MLDGNLLRRFDQKWTYVVETGCWLWDSAKTKDGYGLIHTASYQPAIYAHRVAYERWLGKIPSGMFVCHSCDEPSCVNPGHLFAGTTLDNALDMVGKDRHTRGERNGLSRLTDAAVSEIRKRYASGNVSQRRLAKEYSVSKGTIDKMLRRLTWTHI